MMFGLDGMVKAIAEAPTDVLREGRIRPLACTLMGHLAANPKALEWSPTVIAYTAFELAEAFDDLAMSRYK